MIHLIRQNYLKNARLFCKIKRQLSSVLGDGVAIEHVGSTAIKRMSGKNIIDVLVGIPENEKVEKIAKKIDEMGYSRGKSNPSGDYIFFASRAEETVGGDTHIHLVAKNSERFRNFLALKHYLSNRPLIAKKYSAFKHKIACESGNDRKRYKALKEKYVDRIIMEARNYYGKISE